MELKPYRLKRNEHDELTYNIYHKTGKKFQQFLPFAYYLYFEVQIIELFIFNSDGTVFKSGYCDLSEIYDYKTNPGYQTVKQFEQLFDIKLYKKIGDAIYKN